MSEWPSARVTLRRLAFHGSAYDVVVIPSGASRAYGISPSTLMIARGRPLRHRPAESHGHARRLRDRHVPDAARRSPDGRVDDTGARVAQARQEHDHRDGDRFENRQADRRARDDRPARRRRGGKTVRDRPQEGREARRDLGALVIRAIQRRGRGAGGTIASRPPSRPASWEAWRLRGPAATPLPESPRDPAPASTRA